MPTLRSVVDASSPVGRIKYEDIGSPFDEAVDASYSSVLAGEHQRGLAVMIQGVEMGSVLEQQPENVGLAVRSCVVERRKTIDRQSTICELGMLVEKKTCVLKIALANGAEQLPLRISPAAHSAPHRHQETAFLL